MNNSSIKDILANKTKSQRNARNTRNLYSSRYFHCKAKQTEDIRKNAKENKLLKIHQWKSHEKENRYKEMKNE